MQTRNTVFRAVQSTHGGKKPGVNLSQKLPVVLTNTQCMSTYQEPFLESSYQTVMFPEGYTCFFKSRFYSFLADTVSCSSFVVSVNRFSREYWQFYGEYECKKFSLNYYSIIKMNDMLEDSVEIEH